MEIYLIFSFVLLATLFIVLAKLFEFRAFSRLFLIASGTIFIFIGISLMSSGYQILNTQTNSTFAYSYFPVTNTNEVMNTTILRTQVLQPVQDSFSQMIGVLVLASGSIIGLASAINFNKDKV